MRDPDKNDKNDKNDKDLVVVDLTGGRPRDWWYDAQGEEPKSRSSE